MQGKERKEEEKEGKKKSPLPVAVIVSASLSCTWGISVLSASFYCVLISKRAVH